MSSFVSWGHEVLIRSFVSWGHEVWIRSQHLPYSQQINAILWIHIMPYPHTQVISSRTRGSSQIQNSDVELRRTRLYSDALMMSP